MEFDDRDEEEHEEEDDDDDDDDDINLPPPQSYDSVPQPSSTRPHLGQLAGPRKPTATKYRECLKNHAVSIGGHATDGCGEFLPAGDEGTLDALKCAACGCHRNFHRKETDVGIIDPHMSVSPLAVAGGGTVVAAAANSAAAAMYHHPLPPYYHHHRTTSPPTGYLQLGGPGGGMAALNSPTLSSQHHHHHLQYRPLALPSPRDEMDDMSHPSSSGGGGGGGGSGGNYGGGATGKKRFRTKFSQEQKEKMLVFAERVGWRLQKQDEGLVQQFCQEAQVKRQVLKVWMHNNKHTLGKKTLEHN